MSSSIYEYTGQSDDIEETINKHGRFIMQSSCSPNLLVQFFPVY